MAPPFPSPSLIMALSTPISSPNSFNITAILFPCCEFSMWFTSFFHKINQRRSERERERDWLYQKFEKKNQIVKVFLQWICRSRGSLWWRLLRRKRRRLVVAALSVWFLRRFEQRAVALLHRPPFFSNGIALSLSLSVAAGIQLKDSGLRAFFFFFLGKLQSKILGFKPWSLYFIHPLLASRLCGH